MKRVYTILITVLAAASLLFAGCSHDSEPNPPVKPESVSNVVLVYAANNSNLSQNFRLDSIEMVQAMMDVDDSGKQLLVYRMSPDKKDYGLYTAVRKKNGNYDFRLLKSFSDGNVSTNPSRISEVISDALEIYPQATYDLIFWGHGTGWIYPTGKDQVSKSGMQKSYGGEYGSGSNRLWTNIDDLANALPDDKFRTIWFDCCYMASIEVIYQFRNKCKTFVGYASEVYDKGADYRDLLPRLFSYSPDYEAAARSFFESYDRNNDAVTVAVVDMSHIPGLAQSAKNILANRSELPLKSSLTNYSRESTKLYDMMQYLAGIAEINMPESSEELTDLLGNSFRLAVPFHAESAKNFSGGHLNQGNTCGVTTHYYDGNDEAQNQYYVTLDWYRDVY